MFNSALLEVLIALAFVYLMLSLVVSALTEAVNARLAKRSAMLKKAMDKVFDDRLNKNFSEMLFEHPLIARLKRHPRHSPSYISSQSFAMALIDLIGNEGNETVFYKNEKGETKFTEEIDSDPYLAFKGGLQKMNESDLKRTLQVVLYHSKDYNGLKENIEKWFNDYMDRVGGWFKSDMKKWVFGISACVTLCVNVDSIYLFKKLWGDAQLRQTVVAAAEQYVQAEQRPVSSTSPEEEIAVLPVDSTVAKIKGLYGKLDLLGLPIGWEVDEEELGRTPASLRDWADHIWLHSVHYFLKVVGWLVTAIAISFGAPFWFDALNRLVNFRNAGKKPAAS